MIGQLTMSVLDAEKRDDIIVQGKKATALANRDFLIINLKIMNPINQGVGINTRDFFRLSTNNGTEWLAPEIHNDTKENEVEVQAISTKNTRVAFPINETDTNIVLQVGPIEGEKQQIPLLF